MGFLSSALKIKCAFGKFGRLPFSCFALNNLSFKKKSCPSPLIRRFVSELHPTREVVNLSSRLLFVYVLIAAGTPEFTSLSAFYFQPLQSLLNHPPPPLPREVRVKEAGISRLRTRRLDGRPDVAEVMLCVTCVAMETRRKANRSTECVPAAVRLYTPSDRQGGFETNEEKKN